MNKLIKLIPDFVDDNGKNYAFRQKQDAAYQWMRLSTKDSVNEKIGSSGYTPLVSLMENNKGFIYQLFQDPNVDLNVLDDDGFGGIDFKRLSVFEYIIYHSKGLIGKNEHTELFIADLEKIIVKRKDEINEGIKSRARPLSLNMFFTTMYLGILNKGYNTNYLRIIELIDNNFPFFLTLRPKEETEKALRDISGLIDATESEVTFDKNFNLIKSDDFNKKEEISKLRYFYDKAYKNLSDFDLDCNNRVFLNKKIEKILPTNQKSSPSISN